MSGKRRENKPSPSNYGSGGGDPWDGPDERWDAPWADEYGEDGTPPAPRAKRTTWVGSNERDESYHERRKIDFTRPWDKQDQPPADIPPSPPIALGAADQESIAAIIRAAVPDVRFAMVSIARPFPGFRSVVIIGMVPASAA